MKFEVIEFGLGFGSTCELYVWNEIAIFGVGEQGGKSLNVDPLIPSVLVDWPAKISSDKKIV